MTFKRGLKMTALEKLKKSKERGKSKKNIARIENNFIEGFIAKSSLIPLKILFYIARSDLKNNTLTPVRTITMDSNALCEYCNINPQTLRKVIKNNLMKTAITTVNTVEELEYTVLIPRAKFKLNSTIIEIDIYDNILNLILEVKNKYTSIDTQNLMKLNNKHSIKMIQLLEQIAGFSSNIPKRKIYNLDEFNALFGTSYKSCYEFDRRILAPAKKELDSESKLTFVYETKYQAKAKGRPKGVGFIINLINNKVRQTTMF